MAKKIRIPVPDEIATNILFISDRTCCICNIRGKNIQIHHIDGNPANNHIENLSVLCFDCHDQTMIKGGFGRKLEANQIKKYRNDWHERVKKRKENADKIASIQSVTGISQSVIENNNDQEDFLNYKTNDDQYLLIEYLQNLLIIHNAQNIIAQTKRDSGYTQTMNQGNYDMVAFYEEVLIELSTFYPKGHFNNLPPKKYFSEIISSKFMWYYLVMEPEGAGTGGTMVSTMVGVDVIEDLKIMITDMVNSLLSHRVSKNEIDFIKWRDKWLKI